MQLLVPGLLVAGYGLLIVLGLLAHESRLVGLGLLVAGGVLAAIALRAREPRTEAAPVESLPAKRAFSAGLGAVAAGGVLAYNLATASTLELPELAILTYGLTLIAASRFLDRRLAGARVETLVAWSLPLLAGPLALYALDAAIDAAAGGGASPLDGAIRHGLVAPMAATLTLLGLDAATVGQTVILGTPRGTLALGVGLVCAGLHPGALFLGVFGLFAWQERTPPKRLAALLALGLAGVYLANLLRLVALALVGVRWGGAALQTAHQHLGWMLFVGWMIAYWWLVLRHFNGPARNPANA